MLPTFSPKHLLFSETNCKNTMRNQQVSDSKTSSSVCSFSCYSITILHHGHQEWSPAGGGVWLFTCVFMCAVKHHHESCLVSNKHRINTFILTNNLYKLNFLSRLPLLFRCEIRQCHKCNMRLNMRSIQFVCCSFRLDQWTQKHLNMRENYLSNMEKWKL